MLSPRPPNAPGRHVWRPYVAPHWHCHRPRLVKRPDPTESRRRVGVVGWAQRRAVAGGPGRRGARGCEGRWRRQPPRARAWRAGAAPPAGCRTARAGLTSRPATDPSPDQSNPRPHLARRARDRITRHAQPRAGGRTAAGTPITARCRNEPRGRRPAGVICGAPGRHAGARRLLAGAGGVGQVPGPGEAAQGGAEVGPAARAPPTRCAAAPRAARARPAGARPGGPAGGRGAQDRRSGAAAAAAARPCLSAAPAVALPRPTLCAALRPHPGAPVPLPRSIPSPTPPHPQRKQSFYEPEPRQLRAALRAGYEALLFLDAGFAAANDTEQALWKAVYYRPIEEFRARMRRAEKVRRAGGRAGGRFQGSVSRRGSAPGSREQARRRAAAPDTLPIAPAPPAARRAARPAPTRGASSSRARSRRS
jgi:hypothetical protein